MSNHSFRRGPVGSPSRRRPAGMALLSLLFVSGCSTPNEPPTAPRPVRVFQVGEAGLSGAAGFAGEITPRRETTLAFRVPGKVAIRWVEVGDRVRKGQAIARLEASDYRLATQNLKAQLAAARAERDFTAADSARYRELLDQNIVSPPEWDRHQTAAVAAREKVAALEAQLEQTANQLGYSELAAERDGVIAALNIEAGDVVAAGQPVARLAQLDDKEITIQVPEQRIAEIAPGQEIAVTLWARPDLRLKASIRELAAAADPATRTYRVKASLLEGQEQTRLGMTATLWLPARPSATLAIPRSAVFAAHAEPQQAKVWLVDAQAHTVRSVPVALGRTLDGQRIEVSGLVPGQVVVSAGVQRLTEGQAVSLYQPGGRS